MFYLNQTTHQSNSATAWLLGLLCAVLMLTAGVTFADEDAPNDDPLGVNRLPEIAKDIGVDSKLGDIIDFDVPFHDEENRFVQLFELPQTVQCSVGEHGQHSGPNQIQSRQGL